MKNKKLLLALTLMMTLVMLASCAFLTQDPKSAYDIAVENGFQGSKEDWLASLKGNDGNQGNQGKSAYELYCELFGYEGSEEQWLIDLRTGALISFKVTFDLNGGVAPENFVPSMTVNGGSFLDLKTPARDGYTFVGWWTGDSNTDFAMSETIAVRSDLTLTAKWRKDVMSVRFLDKDGKLLKQETVSYGGAATAPEAPEVAEFMFQKWDVDFSVITEDLIVKAVYSPLYKLSFNTDGGTVMTDVTYCADEIPVIPTAPKKSGYVFAGWYADKDFTVSYDFSTPLTQNTTIYACFSDMIPISTAEELKAIGDNSTGKFYLTNDINLGGEVWTPLVDFAGEFDGQGYKIHNFIISETQSAGFFTTNSGTIKNLTLADFVFTVSTKNSEGVFVAGALVGTNDGMIENCHITDTVLTYHSYEQGAGIYTSWAGGIVGCNNGAILNCSVKADVSCCSEIYANASGSNTGVMRLMFGGAVGYNTGTIIGTVSHTEMQGSAIGNDASNDVAAPYLDIGGFVSNNKGEISLCKSYVTLTTTTATQNDNGVLPRIEFGGFVYENNGMIYECSADGIYDLSDTPLWNLIVGGFVGVNENQMADCHTSVIIKTAAARTSSSNENNIGGFVAINRGTIKTSYTSSTITTQTKGYFGGFVGNNESGGVINKCFATGDITYTGTPLAVGLFVGITNDGGTFFKNYYNSESKILQGETDVTVEDSNATSATLATLQSKAFLVDTLGYNTEVWEIVDRQYPTLKKGE